MDNLDGPSGPRRVVHDVNNMQPETRSATKSSRNKRRRKNNSAVRVERKQSDGDEYTDTPAQAIPLELWPAIQEILGYGKRTHALGAMKAASALSNIVNRLRALGPPDPDLEEIMVDAERESENIRSMLCRTYEE